MAFRIASSPFTHNQQSTQRIMLWVIFACIPGISAQAYFFGYGNLIQCALAIVTALLTEGLVLRLRQKNIAKTLGDNSALLTALLLGISLPPLAPWWMWFLVLPLRLLLQNSCMAVLGKIRLTRP